MAAFRQKQEEVERSRMEAEDTLSKVARTISSLRTEIEVIKAHDAIRRETSEALTRKAQAFRMKLQSSGPRCSLF